MPTNQDATGQAGRLPDFKTLFKLLPDCHIERQEGCLVHRRNPDACYFASGYAAGRVALLAELAASAGEGLTNAELDASTKGVHYPGFERAAADAATRKEAVRRGAQVRALREALANLVRADAAIHLIGVPKDDMLLQQERLIEAEFVLAAVPAEEKP